MIHRQGNSQWNDGHIPIFMRLDESPEVAEASTREWLRRLGSLPAGNGKDEGATKPSNPKDVIGSRKASFSLVPWTLMWAAAHALLEGALKYGRFNWRIAGVRASIYLDACKRHLAKWENGQECDPKTKVHHIDSAIASLAILRDAMVYGKCEDDRPPCPDTDLMDRLIDADEDLGVHLRQEFKDHSPHQFTIADTQGDLT